MRATLTTHQHPLLLLLLVLLLGHGSAVRFAATAPFLRLSSKIALHSRAGVSIAAYSYPINN
jgi:hypothetical protein